MIRSIVLAVKKGIVLCLLITMIIGKVTLLYAQTEAVAPQNGMVTQAKPPMQNVFFNVLWGSLCGGMLFMGWSTLDDSVPSQDRYKFSRLTTQFLTGATYGGILGLATGVYLSIKGISFDENLTRIAGNYSGEQEYHLKQYHSMQLSKSPDSITLLDIHFKF